MELYAFFHRKDEEIRSQHCVVEKVLELSEREFARFYQSPLAEYDFTVFHQTPMGQAKMNHVSDNEQDWSQDSGPALSM